MGTQISKILAGKDPGTTVSLTGMKEHGNYGEVMGHQDNSGTTTNSFNQESMIKLFKCQDKRSF